jgi:hypothetical protein
VWVRGTEPAGTAFVESHFAYLPPGGNNSQSSNHPSGYPWTWEPLYGTFIFDFVLYVGYGWWMVWVELNFICFGEQKTYEVEVIWNEYVFYVLVWAICNVKYAMYVIMLCVNGYMLYACFFVTP